MGKRGTWLALGIFLVLLSSAFALVTSIRPVSAAPCCITNDACGPDESCSWPMLNCLFLGSCEKLWCSYDSSYTPGYVGLCSSDSGCGSGQSCTSCLSNVISNHQCLSGTVYKCCVPCSSPSADCDNNGGCETNLDTDVNNCGSCENTCR